MNKNEARKIYLEKITAASLRSWPIFTSAILNLRVETFHEAWMRFRLAHRETLVLAPRGHGKSTILTVAYGLWKAVGRPDLRALIVSNTFMQAQGFLREIKTHIETNDVFRACFGALEPSAGDERKWTQSELQFPRTRIAKEPTFTALGVGGPVIGRHYDIIILDDIIDDDNARTELQRERILTWYQRVLRPCLEPGGELHVVGTRYHPLDLYGHLQKDDVVKIYRHGIDGIETAGVNR